MLMKRLFDRLFEKADPVLPIQPAADNPAPQFTLPRLRTPAELKQTIHQGRLVLPDDLTHIGFGWFSNWEELEEVIIPGSVKAIDSRAFAGCTNLQSVVLQEGVETLDTNVFNGCTKLRRVQLPKSIFGINGWTFFHSGLTEPLFSHDGRTLIYYPQTSEASEYTVPEGVEAIGSRAFIRINGLKSVHLPDSLKRIERMAFVTCGFDEIILPDGVTVEQGAFYDFKQKLTIRRAHPLSLWEDTLEQCRFRGEAFLCARRMEPPKETYWDEPDFRQLSQRCSQGDVRAMDEMKHFFSIKAQENENEMFYQCAEQFWLVRAALYGSAGAAQELEAWLLAHPDSRMVSPAVNELLSGSSYGKTLNALGFLFFEEDREYSLSGMDSHGVVEASSYESEDGPDSDGYGSETYYDWWYLDSFLSLPKGVGFIHSYSHLDRRNNEKKFIALHDEAVQALRRQSV